MLGPACRVRLAFPGVIRRRLALAAAAAALAVPALSSCSTVDAPAAIVNGHTISMKDYRDLLDAVEASNARAAAANASPDQTTTTALDGVYGADQARSVLGAMIGMRLIGDELARLGAPVTDEQRAETETQLKAGDPAGWDAESQILKSVVIELRSATQALDAAIGKLSEADVRALYEAGPSETGLVCLAHIVTATESDAQAVLERIAAGDSFSFAAASRSIDTATAKSDGIVTDPRSGADCFDLSTFARAYGIDLATAARKATVGELTGPVRSALGYEIFYLRPFEDVAATVTAALPSTRAGALAATANVSVNPAIGQWSPVDGGVVSLAAITG